MGDHAESPRLSARTDKHGVVGKSTYLAALFTASLALLLIVFLWIYKPSYVVLLRDLDAATLSSVTAELQRNNIAYRYESASGEILVPEQSLYHAKFALGSKDIEFKNVSQKLLDVTGSINRDTIQSNHPGANFALESELAKTIASIDNIQWARVHLAIDRRAVNTDKDNSRASVFVRLAPGRGLGESQIASIAHLVASSAANLSVENVTVIDQAGNLLKSSGEAISNSESSAQFSYARILEQSYINKIEKILAPIFGENSIRIRVDADIQYSASGATGNATNTIKPSYLVRKLTTTVVVDNKYLKSDEGQWVSIPRRKAELERVEKLIKDSIEFNEQRGDRIHIFNESFGVISNPLVQKGGFSAQDDQAYYLKVLLMAILIVAACYVLLRYLIQKIMEMKPLVLAPDAVSDESGRLEDVAASSQESDSEQKEKPVVVSTYEALLSRTRQQVDNNPVQVVSVIKTWVRDNGR